MSFSACCIAALVLRSMPVPCLGLEESGASGSRCGPLRQILEKEVIQVVFCAEAGRRLGIQTGSETDVRGAPVQKGQGKKYDSFPSELLRLWYGIDIASLISVVPGGGVEPPWPQGPADFESAASASSAIPARGGLPSKYRIGFPLCANPQFFASPAHAPALHPSIACAPAHREGSGFPHPGPANHRSTPVRKWRQPR